MCTAWGSPSLLLNAPAVHTRGWQGRDHAGHTPVPLSTDAEELPQRAGPKGPPQICELSQAV